MDEMMTIAIPESDERFKDFQFIEHSRSKVAKGTGVGNIPRNHVNEITSYLDGSVVYGSDYDRVQELRSHIDGKLKVTSKDAGDLLPLNINQIMNAPGTRYIINTIFYYDNNYSCICYKIFLT